MQPMPAIRYRIQSIDILRGLIMIIMALDHVRDFFFKAVVEGGGASMATDPTNLETTTPALFFTRWITHFCAPVFVFLAGTSAFLITQKKTKKEVSSFLIKRGVWLILIELVIIAFGWTFNPLYNVLILQVIWAIGISMVFLGLLVHLPYKAIFLIGAVIVFGHNLLDYPAISNGVKGGFLSDLLYFSNFSIYNIDNSHFIFIVYSFVPWTGVMFLGYCFGKLFSPGVDGLRRRKTLLQLGIGLILLFIALRLINIYGDPVPWSPQPRGRLFTFLSFINLNKYPPSLDFLSLTIGAGMLALLWLEKVQNKLTGIINVYGRVPLFYYILHFYLIHILVVIVFFISGYSTSQIITPNNPFLFRPPDFGFNLWGVYAVWIFVVVALYPLCKKYDRYKTTHVREKWWLSYI
jgi:uncharacterized membrane protein